VLSAGIPDKTNLIQSGNPFFRKGFFCVAQILVASGWRKGKRHWKRGSIYVPSGNPEDLTGTSIKSA